MAENERFDANAEQTEDAPVTKRTRGRKKKTAVKNSSDPTAQNVPESADLDQRIEKLTKAMESIQQMEDSTTDSEASFWKAKFEELRELRMTEPEKEAERIRQDVQSQFDRMEEMIRKFQEEDAGEVAKLETSRSLVLQNAQAKSTAASGNAQEQVKHLKKLLMAYQSLTGMVLQLQEAENDGSPSGDGEDSFLCTALNRDAKRATQFCVTLPNVPGGNVTFEPIANTTELPEDLRTDFDMSMAQLPILAAKVNCFLFRDAVVDESR